jgi:ribose 5-phosphate isomerase RpiB
VKILKTWLETPFEGGRHERRVVKIEDKQDAPKNDPKPKTPKK